MAWAGKGLCLLVAGAVGAILGSCLGMPRAPLPSTESPPAPLATPASFAPDAARWRTGQIAPELRVPLLDGSTFELSRLRGKIVYVHFTSLAFFGPEGARGVRQLDGFYRHHRCQDVEALTVDVAVGESSAAVPPPVQRAMDRLGEASHYVARVPYDTMVQQFPLGVNLPSWVVVDADSIIRYRGTHPPALARLLGRLGGDGTVASVACTAPTEDTPL